MLMEENKPLAPFTTFGIGGPARWFVEAASEDEIVEATNWARARGLPLFVLGGGSNLLVADRGFDGLVLRVGLRGPSVSQAAQDEPGERIYRVSAGEDWDGFVERAVRENCAGVECLAGIPGTVGGTPVQNVGAYGQEVASTIERVRVFDLQQVTFGEFSAAECGFAYRRSRFNSTDRGRYIVTRVDYRLTPWGAPTLRYAELQRAVQEGALAGKEPSLAEVAAVVRRVRQGKGMLLVEGDPDCRSAGSFFKNPVVSEEQAAQIAAATTKDPPRFPAGPDPENGGRVKLSAAWLIEQAGFAKGYALGAAGISSRHTLALINRDGASATEMLALAGQIGDAVEAEFGIRLEMEPVLVGF
ncbi:MAG TPA: UDP-N-acetylmuramate dehydrogenase [Terracidiphilus sp.]|nr:UDP-N-acetylmuramate dehydrogenase [Terracidiphilus sp.]